MPGTRDHDARTPEPEPTVLLHAPHRPRAARSGPPQRPGPVLRVHIEEISEQRHRPELLSTPPGKTVFDAVGPREVVACSLRKLARRFDPPWWMFWARPRR